MAILVIQHSKISDPGHLGTALRQHGQKVRTVRIDLGQPLPTDLDDVHGVVSLGGPQSANDSDAWVAQELAQTLVEVLVLLEALAAQQEVVLVFFLGEGRV